MPPKPKGALWLRFWMDNLRKNGVATRTLRCEVREAQ
jgi:hypothetical protein